MIHINRNSKDIKSNLILFLIFNRVSLLIILTPILTLEWIKAFLLLEIKIIR